jgi:hypothetical protein
MKKTIYSAVVAYVLGALKIAELPTGEDGKLALSAEQDATLKSEFPGDMYQSAIDKMNTHLGLLAAAKKEEEDTKTAEKQNVLDILAGKKTEENENPEPEKPVIDAAKTVAEQQAVIEALSKQAESETPIKNIVMKGLVGTALAASISTVSHLFGKMPEASGKLFAFEGRNWNARAAGLKTAGKTDFNDVSCLNNHEVK